MQEDINNFSIIVLIGFFTVYLFPQSNSIVSKDNTYTIFYFTLLGN